MNKIITIGKIDYLNCGRKINKVQVELNLTEKIIYRANEPKYVFTASGTIWNNRETDCYQAGQCIDSLLEYLPKNKLLKEIHDIWKEHHLNDMHAGTEEQEAHLKSLGKYQDYNWACDELRKADLYVVPDPRRTNETDLYKYGHGWLYREIPENVIARLKEIMS
tara:strand:+ start:75 stop:566 length:492 start_codon:yes stop_codon:yes gene_type:complete